MATETLDAHLHGNNINMGPGKDGDDVEKSIDVDKTQDAGDLPVVSEVEEDPGSNDVPDLEIDAEVISSDDEDESLPTVKEESIAAQAAYQDLQRDLQNVEISESSEVEKRDIGELSSACVDIGHNNDEAQPESIQETHIQKLPINVQSSEDHVTQPTVPTLQVQQQTECATNSTKQQSESVAKVHIQQQQGGHDNEPVQEEGPKSLQSQCVHYTREPQELDNVTTCSVPSQQQGEHGGDTYVPEDLKGPLPLRSQNLSNTPKLPVSSKLPDTENVAKVSLSLQQKPQKEDDHNRPVQKEAKDSLPQQTQDTSSPTVPPVLSNQQNIESIATCNIQVPSQEQQQIKSGHKPPVQVEQRDQHSAAANATGVSQKSPDQDSQQSQSQVIDNELRQESSSQGSEEKKKKKKKRLSPEQDSQQNQSQVIDKELRQESSSQGSEEKKKKKKKRLSPKQDSQQNQSQVIDNDLQQESSLQGPEEKKKKKKKRLSLKNLKRKFSKDKSKSNKSDVTSGDERTEDGKEPIASVDISSPCSPMSPCDDDSDVAQVHYTGRRSKSSLHHDLSSSGSSIGSKSEEEASFQYRQQHSAGVGQDNLAQVDSREASVSYREQVSQQESEPEARPEPTRVVRKRPVPPLDKSKRIPVNFNKPPRYNPKCSPLEQYYDVLIIHSDKDLEEVDYMKKIGKRYGWKMISVEEFPAGMTQFQIFSTMLARCTYSMLLLTYDFFGDVWCNHRYSACLTSAVVNRTDHWSVIPVVYQDSEFETPLELITIAGLQREARYFKKNLKSSVCSAVRKEREEELGFPHQPTPPSSPEITPPMMRKSASSPAFPSSAFPEIKEKDTSVMSSGEIYRHLRPELAPNDNVAKIFRCADRFGRICQLLDLEHSFGRDYRLLAELMGFDWSETRCLEQEKSPTAKIIEVFCLKNKDKPKMDILKALLAMVEELEQDEVKSLIENEIKVARFTS